MAIPRTREELVERIEATYAKLRVVLDGIDDADGVDGEGCELACTSDWTVRELICVRARWTEMVNEWIEAGRRGEQVHLPAPGFKWNETPRLSRAIVAAEGAQPWDTTRARLAAGVERTLATVASLSDEELLEPGAFDWAGKWPVSRWLSVNTATQYESACRLVRKALRS